MLPTLLFTLLWVAPLLIGGIWLGITALFERPLVLLLVVGLPIVFIGGPLALVYWMDRRSS